MRANASASIEYQVGSASLPEGADSSFKSKLGSDAAIDQAAALLGGSTLNNIRRIDN